MGRGTRALFLLIAAGVCTPILYNFINAYVTPTTGVFATLGVPEETIAWIGLLPFLFPIILIVMAIVTLAKSDDNDRFSNLRK